MTAFPRNIAEMTLGRIYVSSPAHLDVINMVTGGRGGAAGGQLSQLQTGKGRLMPLSPSMAAGRSQLACRI